MLFSSLTFLLFYLWIVILVYKFIPFKYRNLWLFIVSVIFYGWGEPLYVFIMLISIIVNYIFGSLVKKGKKYLVASIIFNVTLLGFFKYTDFIISLLNMFNLNIPYLHIKLPIGISFYTFQMMSYPIDIYRNEANPADNIITFGAYVTMFPQLVAGPIVRYRDIAEELKKRSESIDRFYKGILRFICGLSKKVLLANNIGYIFESIMGLEISDISMATAWLGIIAFGLQIYFDFSGYSDMAIGMGDMFGFTFLENFNYPYIATSATEFFRRWHMSLGTWFRDYVYIPLGGNKKSHIRNILLVWGLTGLWHGASLNFLMWGLYFGLVLLVEKYFLLKYLRKGICSHMYALFVVMIGWVLFSITDISLIAQYFKAMFNFKNMVDMEALSYLRTYLVLIFIGCIAAVPATKIFFTRLFKGHEWIYGLLMLAGLISCLSFIVSSSYNPFLYFRF